MIIVSGLLNFLTSVLLLFNQDEVEFLRELRPMQNNSTQSAGPNENNSNSYHSNYNWVCYSVVKSILRIYFILTVKTLMEVERKLMVTLFIEWMKYDHLTTGSLP